LHGKTVAKANRSLSLLGNRLDKLIRDGQDGQTLGIPVGPDTSLLISEVILAAVDDLLVNKLGKLHGFRHMDDYELCFPTLAEAEKALNVLESILADFELSINPLKTQISELSLDPLKTQIRTAPLTLQENWATELNRFQIRMSPKAQRNDLIGFFSLAIELASRFPDQSVLRYAIARFRGETVQPANVALFQDLLLYCISCEQGTMPHVLTQLVLLHNNGHKVGKAKLKEVLNSHIQYRAKMGRTGEVAWSLWGALAFGVQLKAASAKAVSKLDDSIVALLALDAEDRGLFNSKLDKSVWAKHMTQRSLYEEDWLLSYEANVKGWMSSLGGGDHVADDPNFGFLKTKGVEFYDLSQASPVVPKATQPLPGVTAY
jgi:hypothetical protein